MKGIDFMAYPKPLSEKSLARLYAQSGLSEKQIDYLHRFFRACAHLYGAIDLHAVWDLYREELMSMRIHRKDFYFFSGIARRESQPYAVYEIDELYTEEKRTDGSREIISSPLVLAGVDKLVRYYRLQNLRKSTPWYHAPDILSFAEAKLPPEGEHLLSFLNSLKVTAEVSRSAFGDTIPCEHRGLRLGQFSFLNCFERFDEEYYAARSRELAWRREERAGTEAEKILRQYHLRQCIGYPTPTDSLQMVFSELQEVGVELSDQQMNHLLQLLQDFHNHTHLWRNGGWSPYELYDVTPRTSAPSISFGPGLQKMFEDGSIDKDETIRMLRKMGLKVIE